MLKSLSLGLVASLYLGAPVPTYAAAWQGNAFTGDLAPVVLARGGSDDNGSDDHGGRGGDDRADDDRGHGESGHGRGRGRGRGGDDGADHDMNDDDDGDDSGRDRPRIPGGSGCDDPEDILEHPECSAPQG